MKCSTKNIVIVVAALALAVIVGIIFFTPAQTEPDLGIGNIIEFGNYEWRVIDAQDGKILILSEYIVRGPVEFHGSGGSVRWENSQTRRYLNTEFLDSFSTYERSKIVETYVVNTDNPWFDTYGGRNTMDYIFLLSIEEAVLYFGDSGQLANRPHQRSVAIDDEYNHLRVAQSLDNSNAIFWWLRSTGITDRTAAFVGRDGINVMGMFAGYTYGGIRPAMWLNP